MSEADLDRFYESEYRYLYSDSNETPSALLIEDQLRRGKAILDECAAHLPAGAKVLDVGCGPGATLLPFRDAGYDPSGYEPGPYGRWGADEYGLDIRMALPLEHAADADLVLLSFVLEHVFCPTAMLKRLGQTMHEGALIYLAVPNLWRAFLPMSSYFHVAHLSYFTPRSLARVVREAGFGVVSLDESDSYAVSCTARRLPETAAGGPVVEEHHHRDSVRELMRHLRSYRRRSLLMEAKHRLRTEGTRVLRLTKQLSSSAAHKVLGRARRKTRHRS